MAGRLVLTNTASAPLRARYDALNYADFTVSATGDLTIAPTGGDTTITGTLAVSSTLAVTGAVTGGTYNGQTISSAASLTGTLAVAGVATFSGHIVASMIRRATSDGADNSQVTIHGGGADSLDRGANVTVFGNEASGLPGYVRIFSGNVSGSRIEFWNGATLRGFMGGSLFLWGDTTTTSMATGDARFGNVVWIKDGAAGVPTATAGFVALYVDPTSGDLMCRFGDGVTKTLATDT
jgi:hypothetical protein